MTEQRAFSWPAATGRADPATSREAEIRITRSGTRQTHAERVLAVVTAAPGLTAPAIADRAGLSHVAAQRRLSDLAQMGRLAKGEPLEVPGRGRMVTWYPTRREEM